MRTVAYPSYPIPVHRSVLDHGMTVWTAKRRSDITIAQLTLPIGSLDDGVHPGAAHFLEHLVYEGPAREGVHPRLRSLVVRGAEADAATSTHHTEYWIRGRSSNFPDMLPALLGIVFDATITARATHAEQSVIAQEIRQCDPAQRYVRWVHEMVYPGHPLLHVPPAGTIESIDGITPSTLRARFARWYQPHHAGLIVVGPHDHHAVLDIAGAARTSPERSRNALAVRAAIPPTLTRATYRGTDEPERITLYFPAPRTHRDVIRCSLALDLLTDAPFGLLFRALRVDAGIVYSIRSALVDWPTPRIVIAANAPAAHHTRIEDACFDAIDRVARGDFPEDVFATMRARRAMFFATRREMDPAAWIDWLNDRWLEHNTEDVDLPPIIQRATRGIIGVTASTFLSREQYGCLTVVHS